MMTTYIDSESQKLQERIKYIDFLVAIPTD